LQFICKYLEWMQLRTQHGNTTNVKLMTDEEMQAIEPRTCVDLFGELLYDIGLDIEEYKPFIRRNLYPRWKDGRKRR